MSIDYELAKEMKDAGFPQEVTRGMYYREVDGEQRLLPGMAPDCTRVPTLEEVIEECAKKGDDFRLMGCFCSNTSTPTWWSANLMKKTNELERWSSGKTPLEAACRLWLADNKKV
jgi:hypothetical protein